MNLNLKPLVGQSVSSVEKKDFTWFFRLSGGDLIFTEQAWRLVTASGIFVTSEDHAQQFGLPAPIDAAVRVKDNLKSEPISEATHDPKAGDLFLNFSADKYLQFLQMSSGYESWRLQIRNREFICIGGGEYASFERQQN